VVPYAPDLDSQTGAYALCPWLPSPLNGPVTIATMATTSAKLIVPTSVPEQADLTGRPLMPLRI
jgi:hypothetical protein